MLHVLELLPDPVVTLGELRHLLRPSGRLVVEVPNAGSVDALWPPLRPLVLDLPFHTHHFTPKTLSAVVARAGFMPLEVRRFNPLALERALARRSRRDAPATAPGTAAAPASPPPTSDAASALWQRSVPRVRRALPGLKLQLIASA
jgi:hypothetical protein